MRENPQIENQAKLGRHGRIANTDDIHQTELALPSLPNEGWSSQEHPSQAHPASPARAHPASPARADSTRRKNTTGTKHPFLKGVLITLALLFALCVAGLCFIRFAWLSDLPDYADAEDFNYNRPTNIYAADHETLLAQIQLEPRVPVESLDEISPYVTVGTIATEDERFYAHEGVDPQSILRAIWNNVRGGSLEGASTITQQLVRNTILADERDQISLQRKVREAYLATKMEDMFSKDDILLMYLNTINYGAGAFGIEAASQRYFSKSADELSLNEAATLVAIPQSPVYNDPSIYPDHALDRRNLVLDRMASNGFITQELCDQTKEEPIMLNMSEIVNDGIIMFPYFSSYVRDQLSNLEELSTKDVFKGGFTVYTTLDVKAQETAEIAAANKEAKAGDSFEVSLVAVDPDNGFVRAMVGGRSFYTDQYNLATMGARQAGSSFKTFTLIAALEEGISPDTLVNCNPSITIGDWNVSNIDGRDYGTRSIASAFAVSSNTGFARIIDTVGADKVADAAYRMGITSELNVDNSLTLGTGEVSPLDMAVAYATIANGGTHYDPIVIEQVLDTDGTVLLDNTAPEGTAAISPEVAATATDVMRQVIESSEGTGYEAKLECGQDAAGKTGTTEYYHDSWFCGITPQYSVAIWLGDRTNTATLEPDVTASSAFSDFLDAMLAGQEHESFPDAAEPEYFREFSSADLDAEVSY